VKTPALWRKKRNGRYYGAWLATIDGVDVNLGTKNAELARPRLVEALRGKREFPSDAELAAQALEADFRGAAAAETPMPTAGAPGPTPEPAAAPQAPAPAAAPVVPDAIEPPRALPPMSPNSEAEARAEAEATNAAAAETAGAGGAQAGEAAAPAFTPDALKGMLQTCAVVLVECQLQLQAWAVKKKTGKDPDPVPDSPSFPLRKYAADAWVAQFERWFPDMGDVPPWVLAAGLPLLALPVQIASAASKPEPKPADAPPAQAAA